MARFKTEDVDALRERADIVEVISTYSPLKRSGAHTFKGLCPFHSEKTPSFTVDAAKGLYYCFGCGEGGNIYHFVQKAENLAFPDSVEWLARKTGFQLRYEESRPGDARAAGMKTRLLEANAAAARFFHERLFDSPDASDARSYLHGRGFGKDVAARWELGYAPGRDALCSHLLSRGFNPKEIEDAGLARRSERDGSLYDAFRGRITFPTWNLQGDVVGFGARALGDQQPKYLNTSETQVFSKSRVMYGLNRAKSSIARSHALVVEGYTDVIALHEAGIEQAVATNGVALGETHFELLKKFSSRVVLMFDADAAGTAATERGFGIHHRVGLEVLVAPLPSGRDPAEVVRSDGADGIARVIEAAQPLLEFKLHQTLDRVPDDTPEARAAAVRAAVEVLGWHPDPIARHEYAFTTARRIGVDPEVVQRALGERAFGSTEGAGVAANGGRDRSLPGHVKVEREALQLMLTASHDVARWARESTDADFTSPTRQELFRSARRAVDSGAAPAELVEDLSPDARALFAELSVGVAPGDTPADERAREVFTRLKVFGLEREIKKRSRILEEVNPIDDPARHDELFTELVALEAGRRDLLRRLEGVPT